MNPINNSVRSPYWGERNQRRLRDNHLTVDLLGLPETGVEEGTFVGSSFGEEGSVGLQGLAGNDLRAVSAHFEDGVLFRFVIVIHLSNNIISSY